MNIHGDEAWSIQTYFLLTQTCQYSLSFTPLEVKPLDPLYFFCTPGMFYRGVRAFHNSLQIPYNSSKFHFLLAAAYDAALS